MRFLNNLTHTGDYSGQPFDLRPWQSDPIRKLFGTLRPDGLRQFRKTFWALPRKQGKTELVAGGSLLMLLGQRRRNQAIYTASGDKEQAAIIYRAACEMISNDPRLAAITEIYETDKRIVVPATNSFLKVLSSVPKSKHGLGPTGVLIDEYHVVQEELVRVLTTGFAARLEPITWMITTAGHDRSSLCYDEWKYALRVKENPSLDPSYLPVIHAADPDDDWTAEATWYKAMPALGDFCSIDFIREEFKAAMERPRLVNSFKQLYLNIWTEAASRWLSMERWAKCRAPLAETEHAGRPCFAGLDLGVTGDMSAFVVIFPRGDGGYDVRCKFWVPENGIWRKEPRNAALYASWHALGLLEFTPGESQDHGAIETHIVAANAANPIRMLAADRAYAQWLLSKLFNDHGIPVESITQGPVTLNQAMVKAEELILSGLLAHGDHPVLSYNAGNADSQRTSTGLMSLDKSSKTARIDGLAALLNALVVALAAGGGQELAKPSRYINRGIRFIR